jgi:hypothetical protein
MNKTTIAFISSLLVVAAVSALLMVSWQEVMPERPNEVTREASPASPQAFSCGALPEISFSYTAPAGWEISAGESAVLDGRAECQLQVVSRDGAATAAAIAVLRQNQDSSIPDGVMRNAQGLGYQIVSEELDAAAGDARHYAYVVIYTPEALYWVQLIGLSQGVFPASEFLQQVADTFSIE